MNNSDTNSESKLSYFKVAGLPSLGPQEIKLDTDKFVFYMMGANGVGKTSILKLINSCLSSNWSRLNEIRFTKITLKFEDDVIEIGSDCDTDGCSLKLSLNSGNPLTLITFESEDEENTHIINQAISRGTVIRRACGHWDVGNKKHIRSKKGVVELLQPNNSDTINKLPSKVQQLLSKEFSLFIDADRAGKEFVSGNQEFFDENQIKESMRLSVVRKVQAFSDEIGSALSSYENETRRKHQEFINQLLRGVEFDTNVENSTLQSKVDKYKERMEHLNDAGIISELVDSVKLEDLDINKTGWVIENLINSFITSFDEKMKEKFELSKLLISFLENAIPTKSFEFINTRFEIYSKKTREKIQPEHLSSGEQQLFILGYEILSKCNSDSLVLIDEPELSMDPEMKSTFVDFLKKAAKLRNSRFLLATHSHLVVGKERDDAQILTWEGNASD